MKSKTPYNFNGIGFFMEDVRAIRVKLKPNDFSSAISTDKWLLQLSFAGGGWITVLAEKVSSNSRYANEAEQRVRSHQQAFENFWTEFKNQQL